jgi:hypothetical protein
MGGQRGRRGNLIPQGKPHRGGLQPRPGDERFGDYTRERLLQMDNNFATAVEQALARGKERPPPALRPARPSACWPIGTTSTPPTSATVDNTEPRYDSRA